MTTLKSRKLVLGAVLALLGLPVALAVTDAVAFHVQNRSNGSLVSSGREREYLLYVPTSYDRTRPTPLVISMHGGAGWGAAQKEISQWNRVAESEGFIVVYPSGEGGGPRGWHVEPGVRTDVQFIAELIDTLKAAYHIDPTRIYANGYSIGGGMSFVLSCTLSDRIAAVGMVAAAQAVPFGWCTDRRAVPMIAFHGTADPMVPYQGGLLRDPFHTWRFPAVLKFTAEWARRNRCGANPVESAVAADVTRREYTECADDATVVLYTVQGGGHTWPGTKPMAEWWVGPTSRSIDATSLMWAFFREHRLRP